MTATVNLRLRSRHQPAPHKQCTYALGAVGLVGTEGHQVDRHVFQVNRQLAGRLSRIDMKHRTSALSHLAEGKNVIDRADLVVDVHQRDQRRVLAQR